MKKKMFLIVIMCTMILYAPSVLAVNTQGCSTVFEGIKLDTMIPNTVHTIITIIKIAVPILLVVLGSIDLLKGMISQKEDEIKKGQHTLIKRIIAGVLIFFVVTIVQLVISLVTNSSDSQNIWSCANCFLNGTDNSGNCKDR